jgi:hypothetical protein
MLFTANDERARGGKPQVARNPVSVDWPVMVPLSVRVAPAVVLSVQLLRVTT